MGVCRKMATAAALTGISCALALGSHEEADAQPILSTWYGAESGDYTADGSYFDGSGMTAASPYLPFGTELEVCYTYCTIVTINDRGPYGDAGLDLSRAAADAIGLSDAGKDIIDYTIL